ncbi:MAG: alcohol dehydrogenase catalytic domain-containing protein [Candidatus Hydrogenedentes bacterium]|nr:alcohol dehydrogenase catalytic domain-containing protein [Candidatus Hydrogenedentota bacterium]
MVALPATCRAAVFEGPGKPIAIREFSVPRALPPGSALCRIRLSTVCGSDLHTVSGRRNEPVPSILGHESVGDVVAVGEGTRYWNGKALRVGDRVTWSIMASCGACDRCAAQLPQKCRHIKKYGHLSTDTWPGLTGGYAEYIYLYPGTAIFAVPAALDDSIVAPANCALATAVCAVESIGGVGPGDSVLIMGAGLLGIYLAALAKSAGAGRVLVSDVDRIRADQARRFGADFASSDATDVRGVVRWVRDTGGAEGVDVAFEVCGDPRAAAAAIEALRIGGRLLLAGMVTPGCLFEVDGNVITRKCLMMRGIHNYHPAHLERGLRLLDAESRRYPFAGLVSEIFDLGRADSAFASARTGRALRVGLRPGDSREGSV